MTSDLVPIAVGAGVGGCVFVLLVGALVAYFVQRRDNKKPANSSRAYNDDYESAVQMDDALAPMEATRNSTVDDTLRFPASGGAGRSGSTGLGDGALAAGTGTGGGGAAAGAYGTSFSPIVAGGSVSHKGGGSTVSSFSAVPSPPKSVSDYGFVPEDLNEVPAGDYDRAPDIE